MLDLSDGRFLKTLRMLKIITRRYFKGQKIGQRRSKRKGGGVEFSDYKEYNPGDDLRYLDWRIYGRLDKLFIKLFHSEENLNVYVLVDVSSSMNFGVPSKFDYARKVAAAVAYIAASNLDKVRVLAFADRMGDQTGSIVKTGQVLNLFRFLEKLSSQGKSDLRATAKDFVLRYRRPGIVFVVSDFFFNEEWREGIKLLRYHRHEVNLIHILQDEEVDPKFAGLWTFIDAESSEEQQVFVDTHVLDLYRETAETYFRGIEEFCTASGVNYFKGITSVPFENMILQFFGR